MAELRTLVDREMDLAGLPSYGFDDLFRRRDRKQRNRRIAAGAVALVLVALVIGGWLRAITLDRSTPADRGGTGKVGLPSTSEDWARAPSPVGGSGGGTTLGDDGNRVYAITAGGRVMERFRQAVERG